MFSSSYPQLANYTNDTAKGMADSIRARLLQNQANLLEALKYGPQVLLNAIDDEAERFADWEEIGSSDISCAVQNVLNNLRRFQAA